MPAAIADGVSVRPASMLAVAQAIAVMIIGMRRVVWLSLIPIPVLSLPVCISCRLTGSCAAARDNVVAILPADDGR